jgi:hypothetical protein
MMIITYLMVTTIIKDQAIRERIPKAAGSSVPNCVLFPLEASTATFNAYKGDVPMSPNTTPSAPINRKALLDALGEACELVFEDILNQPVI